MVEIAAGDEVVFTCSGALDNGEVVSTSDAPITMIAGVQEGVKLRNFLSQELIGMRPNETKTVPYSFGKVNPALIIQSSRDLVPSAKFQGASCMVDVTIGGKSQKRKALVREIGKEEVLLDFNHPYAGMDVNFSISILSVSKNA